MSAAHHADTGAKLRRMADQIAINLASRGHDQAVRATAEHIDKFWDPRMKAAIFADDWSALSPIAREAIAYLAGGAHPGSRTLGTEFNAVNEVGHSDAG